MMSDGKSLGDDGLARGRDWHQLARQRLDMVVSHRVVVEIKATEQLHPSASAQLFSYLCSTDYEVGLLLHFGHKAEFKRVIFENRLKARRGGA